jgi:hypothetical protein
MLQFGGHHLALNITIVGDRSILTPSLTGAQPGTRIYILCRWEKHHAGKEKEAKT